MMRQRVAVLETTLHALGRGARAEHGQDLVEYGLLAALISVFVIGVVAVLGSTITDTFWKLIVEGFPGV